MKSTNTNSMQDNQNDVSFDNITEAPLTTRPEFYTSVANNPLQGRLDSLSVRQNLLKITDTKSGFQKTTASIEGAFNGFTITLNKNQIKLTKITSNPIVQGWIKLGSGTVYYIGNTIFDLSAGANLITSLSYYTNNTQVIIKFRTTDTLTEFLEYKFLFLDSTL